MLENVSGQPLFLGFFSPDPIPQKNIIEAEQSLRYLLQPTVIKSGGNCDTAPATSGCTVTPSPYLDLLREYATPAQPDAGISAGEDTPRAASWPSMFGWPLDYPPDLFQPNILLGRKRGLVTNKYIAGRIVQEINGGNLDGPNPPSIPGEAGRLPHGVRVVYIVIVDAKYDVTLTGGTALSNVTLHSCSDSFPEEQDFAGYHDYTVMGQVRIPYIVLPLCGIVGFGTNLVSRFTSILTHELAEAVTDPYPPFGWYGPGDWKYAYGGEIADYCGWSSGGPDFSLNTPNGSLSAALIWSNQARQCVVGGPAAITTSGPTFQTFFPVKDFHLISVAARGSTLVAVITIGIDTELVVKTPKVGFHPRKITYSEFPIGAQLRGFRALPTQAVAPLRTAVERSIAKSGGSATPVQRKLIRSLGG